MGVVITLGQYLVFGLVSVRKCRAWFSVTAEIGLRLCTNWQGIFNPYSADFFMKTLETKGFFQVEIIINVSVSSFRFIWNFWIPLELFLQCRDRLWTSESDVYRRQILTTKVYPRAVRVKYISCRVGFVSCYCCYHGRNLQWGCRLVFIHIVKTIFFAGIRPLLGFTSITVTTHPV